MAIRAILFDADEVLQYPEPKRELKLSAILGFMPEPFPRFIAEIHAVEDTTLTGESDFLEALAPLLETWGAPGKAAQLCDWLNLVTVDQDVLSLVARLRQRGYRCVLATNQQPRRARFMSRDLNYGALFDHCFFSCDLGLAKPDPRYFSAILRTLQLTADEALFVDDKPANIEGARSVGVRAECFVDARNGRAHLELQAIFERYGVAGVRGH